MGAFKCKVKMNKLLKKELVKDKWVSVSEVCKQTGMQASTFYSMKSMGIHTDKIKNIGKSVYVNVNQYTFSNDLFLDEKSFTLKRDNYLMMMFDDIYFSLDKYLNDSDKSKMMSAFTGRSYASWTQFFSAYKIGYNDRTAEFIKWGKLMLASKSLYKYFKERW